MGIGWLSLPDAREPEARLLLSSVFVGGRYINARPTPGDMAPARTQQAVDVDVGWYLGMGGRWTPTLDMEISMGLLKAPFFIGYMLLQPVDWLLFDLAGDDRIHGVVEGLVNHWVETRGCVSVAFQVGWRFGSHVGVRLGFEARGYNAGVPDNWSTTQVGPTLALEYRI